MQVSTDRWGCSSEFAGVIETTTMNQYTARIEELNDQLADKERALEIIQAGTFSSRDPQDEDHRINDLWQEIEELRERIKDAEDWEILRDGDFI